MHIILIGFKSCGKTTIGQELAKLTKKNFLDTDTEVENIFQDLHSSQLSCREIYLQFGEAYMRELEGTVLKGLIGKKDSIISTGGGIILNGINRQILQRSGHSIFLDVSIDVLEKRLKPHLESPLFKEKSIRELHKERYPFYKEATNMHYQIPDDCSPEGVAKEIIRRLQL